MKLDTVWPRVRSVASAIILLMAAPHPVWSVPNNGRIPVLTYHSYTAGETQALEQDLLTIDALGYKVIPLYWATQWMLSERDGASLPEKVVALTFDDGADLDWYNNGSIKSVRQVLQDFKASHPGQPNTHGSTFVIASPTARSWISSSMHDDWWAEANNTSGILEVYNHSADHDHPKVGDNVAPFGPGNYDVPPNDPTLFDVDMDMWVAVSAGPGGGPGGGTMAGIDRYQRCYRSITKAASYIWQQTGAWPDLFAYPYDHPAMSPYMWQTYFPNNQAEHQTKAAFATGRGSLPVNYMTRADNRWLVNRFVRGGAFPDGWSTESELKTILNYGLPCKANGVAITCPTMSVLSPTVNAQGRASVAATSVSVLSAAQNSTSPPTYITASSWAKVTRIQSDGRMFTTQPMTWYYAWVTPSICLGPNANTIETDRA